MSFKRGKKTEPLEDNTQNETEISYDGESILLASSYIQKNNSKRRSKRINEKQAVASKNQDKLVSKMQEISLTKRQQDVSLNYSIHDVARQHDLLKTPVSEAFEYNLQEQDVYFMQDFFNELPKLKDIWKRIGFNKDIQEKRLETLYEKLIDTFTDIIESEEELEGHILQSIEDHRATINKLCLEMSIAPSDLKMKKHKSVLEEDEILTTELKSLTAEKHRRLDEYNKVVIVENELSSKLCIEPVKKRDTVPSPRMISDLDIRIHELSALCTQRLQEMASMKEDIMKYSDELGDESRSDSFAEMIIMESVEQMPLGDEDLKRCQEYRDDLRHKDTQITNEIRSLRATIRELWNKLSIGNESIYNLVTSDDYPDTKRQMVAILREEHELCVKVKMENMQKFIDSVRVEIRALLAKMLYGPKEIKTMENNMLSLTDYTEELLTRHEAKKEELEFAYEESQGLFEKATKWIEVWTNFIQFEEDTKDPARFKIRGYNSLTEEKNRRVFNVQLPKLEEDLTQQAREFATTGDQREFTIHGLFFAEFIQRKKQDHEESKINERKEKQLLKDNLKRNESRYGSKPITPLAIRNKRKLLTTQHESVIHTPGRLPRNAKLMRADGTPGTSMLGKSKLATKPGVVPKLSMAAKRKSRTPAKNRFRKSRGLGQNNNDTMANETIKDKTVGSMTSSSSYQTINSTAGSNSSKLAHPTTSTVRSTRQTTTGLVKSSRLPPPQSSSAKFTAASQRIEKVLCSTASNTFIEEEDFENLENPESTVLTKKREPVARMPQPKKIATFTYQHPDSSKYEMNYNDFSRDLVKMQSEVKSNMTRFGGATVLGDNTNSSTLSTTTSRYTSMRAGKTPIASTRVQQEKEKLTSTLLSSS